MTLLRYVRAINARIAKRLHTYQHIDRDIAAQKKALAGYTSGVTKVVESKPLSSGTFAAFVYYEPNGRVSNSARRILESLTRHNVQVLVLCNHELSDDQLEFFHSTVSAVILRNNQGFDFGAYQDAISYLGSLDITIERLLLLNDSVFYSAVGLDEFVARMLGQQDVISAYENWGDERPRHFQSFAISLSAYVFESKEFQDFWSNYVPINNRVHAIEAGEYELSKAIYASARSVDVIFSISALAESMLDKPDCLPHRSFIFAQPWRASLIDFDSSNSAWNDEVATIANILNLTSPIHSGAYLFPKFLQSPIYKKDIVYRGRFQLWEVESWAKDLLPADELNEFVTALRGKGSAASLTKRDHQRYQVGAK